MCMSKKSIPRQPIWYNLMYWHWINISIASLLPIAKQKPDHANAQYSFFPALYAAPLAQWLSVKGLTSHSTHNRSFWRRVFPDNRLHWYWQPKTIKHNTTYTINTKKKQKKTALANKPSYTLVWYAFNDLWPKKRSGPYPYSPGAHTGSSWLRLFLNAMTSHTHPIFVDDMIGDVSSRSQHWTLQRVAQELVSLGVRHVQCQTDGSRPVITQ